MTSIFLSCYNLPVIKQVAQVLGWVMDLLYKFFDMFGIQNIGLCILLFTIIVKMILLPMTIKQQKFTKLSSLMNPEIQAVQKKYQGKKDQDSMMKMNQEMQAIYDKYGTSPTGGCLSLLIQMPILLALYGVISQIPIYIDDINTNVTNVSEIVAESAADDSDSNAQSLYDLYLIDSLLDDEKDEDLEKVIDNYLEVSKKEEIKVEDTEDKIYGQFTTISTSLNDRFKEVFSMYDNASNTLSRLDELSEEDWTKLAESDEDYTELINRYKELDRDQIRSNLKASEDKIRDSKEYIDNAYSFLGVNLSQTPSSMGGLALIIIPLLAALTQLISVKVSNKINAAGNNAADNSMASSMKMMTYTMPIMSAFICLTLPAGLGVYWIMSAVVQTLQTIVIGKYFMNADVNDIIKSNIEKQNKKRAKKGLPPKKITNVASTNVKNIKVEKTNASHAENKPADSTSSAKTTKKGSIASKANLVSKYNDKK